MHKKIFSIILLLFLVFFIDSARGQLTLEADYEVNQNLNIGSPSGGTLMGAASVSNGMLNCTGASGDGVYYGYTRNYLDITDGVSWGNNTIVAVITLDADAYPYDNLFGSGGGYNPDNRDGIKFYAHVPTWPGPALALHNDDGGPINIAMVGVNLGTQYQLSTGKEYFLAASWRDDGAAISMRMYLREIDDVLGTSIKYTSNTQNDPGGPSGFVRTDGYDQRLYVGRSFGGDPIDGGVDIIRVYNNFTDTQNEFNAIFNEFSVSIAYCESYRNTDNNQDCYTNILDLELFASQWLADCDDCTLWADFDYDCNVDFYDFVFIANDWLQCTDIYNNECLISEPPQNPAIFYEDFEDPNGTLPDGWSFRTADAIGSVNMVTTESVSGQRSCLIERSFGTGIAQLSRDGITVNANTEYEVKCYIKSEYESGGYAYLRIEGLNTPINAPELCLSQDWMPFTFRFTTDSDTAVIYLSYILSRGDMKVWLDDFQISPVSSITAKFLVPGGDFEYFGSAGSPGWNFDIVNKVCLRTNKNISYEGLSCAQINLTESDSSFEMSQRVYDFMPGDDYSFSIYALELHENGVIVKQSVDFIDPFGNLISSLERDMQLSEDWTKQSLDFRVPDDCTEVILMLNIAGDRGSVCIDGAEFIDKMTTTIGKLEGDAEWHAIWICHDEEYSGLPVTRYFKKTFSLSEVPEQATAIANVFGDYQIKINGQEVCSGIKSIQSQVVDIKGSLQQGQNVILVEVEGGSIDIPAFIFEAGVVVPSGNDIHITTDSTWQSSEVSDSDWSEPKLLGKWNRIEGGESITYEYVGRKNKLEVVDVNFPDVISQAESVQCAIDMNTLEDLHNDRQVSLTIERKGVLYHQQIIRDANTSNWSAGSNVQITTVVPMDKVFELLPQDEEGQLLGDANVFGGRLNVSGDSTSGVMYDNTVNYLDITEGSSWGENTIVAVIKLDSSSYPYDAFLGSGNGYNTDSRDGIKFYAHDASFPGPALSLHNDDPDGTTVRRATVGVNLGALYQLSTGKEYFLAASWRDDGATISMRMYLREIGDVSGTSVKYTSNTQTDPGGPSGFVRTDGYDQELYIGRPQTGDSIDGAVDMVRFYKTFTNTSSDFNKLFQEVSSTVDYNNVTLEATYNENANLSIGSPYNICVDIPRTEITNIQQNKLLDFRVNKSLFVPVNELAQGELVLAGGNPTYAINGQVHSPLFVALANNPDSPKSVRYFSDSGYNVYKHLVYASSIWTGTNEYDFSSLDNGCMDYLVQNPEASIILNLYFMGKGHPAWWCDAHPEEMAVYWGGSIVSGCREIIAPDVASELYKQDVITLLENTIDHIRSSAYSGHIVGFTINGEPFWACGDDLREALFGYSGNNQKTFNSWLVERFSETELNQIWAGHIVLTDPNGKYQLPTPDDRLASNVGIFRDPAQGRRSILFNEYMSWIKYKFTDDIAKELKWYTDKKILTSKYNGYSMVKGYENTVGYIDGVSSEHEIIESNAIDFTHSPIHYYYRKMGDSSAFMGTVDSVSLKNKLYFAENDMRTFLGDKDTYYLRNSKFTTEVMKRDFSMIFARNAGMYWYDWGGWYDNEGLQKVLSGCNQIYKDNLSRQRSSISEVAVFIDESSPYYFGYDANGSNAYSVMTPQMAGALFRMGTPADIYELDSLADPDFPDYKCYIFLGTVHIDQAMRSVIQNKIYNGTGKTVLWTYGSGLCNDTSLNVSNMNSVTGLQFQQVNQRLPLLVEITSSGSSTVSGFSESDIIGSAAAGEPLFASLNPGSVEVLGNYENTSYAGFFEDTVNSTNVIYYGSGLVPPKLLRNVAVQAGCHMYVDSMDPIYVNNIFFGIHRSGPSGNVTITLPQASKVRDAFSGEWIVSQPQSSFTVYMYSGDTAAFILEN